MDIPAELLDGEVKDAVHRLRAARRELRAGSIEQPNPLAPFRRVSAKTTLIDIVGAQQDPLSVALASWIYVLTLERVLWPDSVRVAAAWNAVTVELEEPEPVR